MENQMARNDNTELPIEFPSQTTETSHDNGTHMEAKDESSKWQTRSEVWGTDPTRRSERISDKVLITKTGEDSPVIKTPKAYRDAMNSPEGKQWRDAMDYEL